MTSHIWGFSISTQCLTRLSKFKQVVVLIKTQHFLLLLPHDKSSLKIKQRETFGEDLTGRKTCLSMH